MMSFSRVAMIPTGFGHQRRILSTAVRRLSVLFAAIALSASDSNAGVVCVNECMTVNNGGPMIYGSGKMKTEMRPVGKFTSVRVSAPATVLIERTGTESLSVTAEDNLVSMLGSEVEGGTLHLSVTKDKSLTGKIPIFRITVADLRRIDVEGPGTVRASRLDAGALSLSVSGSGDIHVAGRSENLAVTIDGSGSVDAAVLQARHGKAVVSGSGELTVNASDSLDATVRGSGSVDYIGSPRLTSRIYGSGSIDPK
jgi:Putative auto-transporter adhesin, head GIN domain